MTRLAAPSFPASHIMSPSAATAARAHSLATSLCALPRSDNSVIRWTADIVLVRRRHALPGVSEDEGDRPAQGGRDRAIFKSASNCKSLVFRLVKQDGLGTPATFSRHDRV